ncbi:MAG: hypothetical protein EHM16_15170 [Betaproteobacteria bacterium]|nr:MAG: hypothetical protein EHM16_15170 [Betaproteobacteria bacterium]
MEHARNRCEGRGDDRQVQRELAVSIQNGRYVRGPLSLQYSGAAKGAPEGAIKWRTVQIKPIEGAGKFRVSGARSKGRRRASLISAPQSVA